MLRNVALILPLLLALLLLPVRSDAAYVAQATWLRAAPDPEAAAIDELRGGDRVQSLECGAGWCRVVAGRAAGFVPQVMLAAEPQPGLVRTGQDCFPAQHFTPAGPVALRICPAR